MNLNQIAAGVIGSVNPQSWLVILVSAGNHTLPDGHRVPLYRQPVMRLGQVQPLTTDDIKHLDSLNIQGEHKSIFINGQVDGLVRVDKRGGDLIVDSTGRVWLTTEVPEAWPDWTRALVTLQDQKERAS